MADTVPSSSTSASLSSRSSYDVFINHRGIDVKKNFASHLYRSLLLHGLRTFLDRPELTVGDNFPSQIIDALTNASVHVALFSPGYADSEWCLNELVYMLDSRAPVIPVFYNVDPTVLRWTQSKGLYAEALRKLEGKRTDDPETGEQKARYDPATIKSWREALSKVSDISGLELQGGCNGDEGELVDKIVTRVLEIIKSSAVHISGFYCSQPYGCPGVVDWSDGTYSGIRRITMTENDDYLTSVQLTYGLEGDETVKDTLICGLRHGVADGALKEYNLNYPEEIVTKISGYSGSYNSWDVIKSLVFHTNQRKLGPCGQEQGIPFEAEGIGKIVGIFGSTTGFCLDSLGVYTLKPRTSTYEEFCRSQPYGGTGGSYWNDGTYSGIRRIIMTEKDNRLTSIQLYYWLEGAESVKDKYMIGLRHGGADGIRRVYDLNYPEEFVTKISGCLGTYGPFDVINSLTFHTNKGKHGPCGQETGPYFETEMGGKIVGVFGSSGDLVDSIGLYMLKQRTSDDKEFHRSQLYGGTGGRYWNDGTYSGIRRITMTANNSNWLTSVQLHYGLEGDESLKDRYFPGLRHGAAAARKQYNLNYPEEFVTKISGYFGRYGPFDVIISLTFHTNQGKHGPCGHEGGTYFETEERGKIVGIFGSSGDLVDSIGVYTLKPKESKVEEFYRSQPYGGLGGRYWNDGTYSGIRRITMTANNNNWLTSVQLHYGLEGDESVKDILIPGLRHGAGGGAQTEYDLNYPEEFVTKISGYFGRYGPFDVIISLTFHTNKGKHGPCGQEAGPYFETEMGGKIIGVFGSSGDLVDSIGVYMLKPRASKDEVSDSD